MLSELDILKSVLQDLGVRPQRKQPSLDFDDTGNEPREIFDADWMQGMTKKQLLDRLNLFLAERAQENVFTVLIVDEAQNVSTTLLEQLRLLSNLETAKKKLIQIIFVGQLELNQKLKALSMRQLNQRISVRFETKTLSSEDTERYVRHRLAVAGGAPRLQFASGTFRAIWRYSKGYPRMINLICDRALLAGYTERAVLITPKLVRKGALALSGQEDSGIHFSPGWLRRLVPFLIPAVLLLSVLLFAISKIK
jgi:general secretion pathway protein A